MHTFTYIYVSSKTTDKLPQSSPPLNLSCVQTSALPLGHKACRNCPSVPQF